MANKFLTNLDVAGSITAENTGTAGVPVLDIINTTASAFNHSVEIMTPNMTTGQNNILVIGRESSTKNSGYIGYKYSGGGSNANVLTFGHWGSDNLMNIDGLGNVGIGTTTPKAKLDVNGRFCVDSKTHNLTNAFTTCLTVNLSSHTGCYVTLTCFGDWGSHSAAAYRGEFFLQNGANAYAEPGIILRQDDNTSNGADQIVCQILDPTGTGDPKDFEIQIRTTATTGTTSFTGQLTYTVQGQFNSIT